MKRDLEPCGPQNAEETNVAEKVVYIGNRVISRESCQIGYEEQVKEQFNAICFVALGEDEMTCIGSNKWRFNPSRCLM